MAWDEIKKTQATTWRELRDETNDGKSCCNEISWQVCESISALFTDKQLNIM